MSSNRLKRLEAPTQLVISTDVVREQLNNVSASSDEFLEGLIASATAQLEGQYASGLTFLTQQWRVIYEVFPHAFELPLWPVQRVVSITYVDGNGQTQTLDPDAYIVDTDSVPARIMPAYGASWPHALPVYGSIKITFDCGFGDDPEDVPADLRQAIAVLVGHLDANRGDGPMEDMPDAVRTIIDRYTVVRLRCCG